MMVLARRELAGQWPVVVALQDDPTSERCDHHTGEGPLCRLLVPPRQGRAGCQQVSAWSGSSTASAEAPIISPALSTARQEKVLKFD
jgi:hypothetical protein